MTYLQKANQITAESSVAVMVLLGAPDDVEFLPLRPRMADEAMLEELKANWSGRGLRIIGVFGLCGASPRCALKEELPAQQVTALASGFMCYLNSFFSDGFAAQIAFDEVAELRRMWQLPAQLN